MTDIQRVPDYFWRFLLLGAVVFVADFCVRTWLVEPSEDERRIVISDAMVQALVQSWEDEHSAAPSSEEEAALIDSLVREEVLYREAKRRGLDRDDLIIRRRLIQKMEFLALDLAEIESPDDVQLQSWLEAHADRYRRPARWTLTHIFFSRDQRGEDIGAEARAALAELDARKPPQEGVAPSIGDPSPLPFWLPGASAQELAGMFGEEFARAMEESPVERWFGPVTSAFGAHLVWVHEKIPGRLPNLDEVRTKVFREVLEARSKEAQRAQFEALLKNYRVEIETSGGDGVAARSE